jgi:hypothetical protein
MKSKALLFLFSCTVLSSVNIIATTEYSSDMAIIFKDLGKADYSTEVLPHNFSHLVTLLDYGKKNQKNTAYAERVMRVFTRLVKGAEYINGHIFADMLVKLPSLLTDYCIPNQTRTLLGDNAVLDMEMFDRFKESVNTVLYNRFLADYATFKKDPDNFLDQLSQQIVSVAQEEVSIKDLHYVILRFLEISLSKLVWSPNDYEASWNSVKKTANQLTKMTESNIIESLDDLDDLYWTLIHSYCDRFVSLWNTQLPNEFYEYINHDICDGKEFLLLDLEEQESWLESKKTYFKRMMQKNQAKRLTQTLTPLATSSLLPMTA